MIYVLEGPDGSGKTTLARSLEARGFHYVHNGVPKPGEDVFEYYTNQALAAKYDSRDVVFDRLHLGEIVYGTVVRNNSLLTIEQIRLINRILSSAGAYTVICLPPFNTILTNWKARQDREYIKDPNTLEQVYNLYKTLLTEYQGNLKVYDYTCDEFTLPDWIFRCPEGVIGSPIARFLFVGEKAGGPHDLAFYSNERSSHYLNECLWDAGYQEHELAFTNAYTMNGRPRRLNRVIGIYGNHTHERETGYSTKFRPVPAGCYTEQRVIALGNLAQRRCQQDNIEYLAASHPQYVKRFKSRQRWRYVELLRTFREA